MRLDLLIIVIGLILVVAMALTLLFGREYSRHGYGCKGTDAKEAIVLTA